MCRDMLVKLESKFKSSTMIQCGLMMLDGQQFFEFGLPRHFRLRMTCFVAQKAEGLRQPVEVLLIFLFVIFGHFFC